MSRQRLECMELAPAPVRSGQPESASKPRTLSGQAGRTPNASRAMSGSRPEAFRRPRPPTRNSELIVARALRAVRRSRGCVAQVSNLLYRRLPAPKALGASRQAVPPSSHLRIGNPRYSRLEVCATRTGSLCYEALAFAGLSSRHALLQRQSSSRTHKRALTGLCRGP